MHSPLHSGSRAAINPEEMMLPANSISFNDTSVMSHKDSDGDSSMDMDICSTSSSDSHVNIDFCGSCSSGEEEVIEPSLKPLKRRRQSKVYDQVYHADRDKSYDRRPMQISMLLKVSKHVSGIANDTEWREFGVFSSVHNKFEAMSLRNVLPAFSPSELSFFTDMELYNVGDLSRSNTNALSIHLLESLNFRKACAFYAWNDGKPLRDYLRFSVARNTVIKWKKTLTQQFQQGSKDAAKNESANKKKDAESNKYTMSPAEIAEKVNNDVGLTCLLSNEETRMLRDHFGIETATQLINASPHMGQTLSEIMAPRFDGRSLHEIECICEGMLYSWLLRSREAIESAQSTATRMETENSCDTISEERAFLPYAKFQTPLSYVDFLFFEQEGILTDHELSLIDPSLLTRQYAAFLRTKGEVISHVDTNKKLKRLRQEASLVHSGLSNVVNSSQNTRLDLGKLPKGVMLSASNLCKTTIDTNNNGLPMKTLIVYDDLNRVLYEFSVSIHDSSIPNSGLGAFLTFKGAKVLKKSSQAKVKNPAKSYRTPATRNPREALFAFSGATVTLTGTNLHGDEYLDEKEKEDSVGVWNEFSQNDFVESDSNITFSSKHVGCALIELDRYAPLLKADRKTEFIFCIKDFLFGHEPSSWRFDVSEKLYVNGLQNQVVDFTDDTTGSPHAVARANTAMYVNECGHDISLVENVCSLETCRSVSYYVYIDRPMEAGETRELLINYREKYEDIRERRGYGLANINLGMKGDDDDVSRVLRNHNERIPTEATIMSCSEDEIQTLVDFIQERVLGGVIEATSQATISGADTDILARQFVARRRIHWISEVCRRRLLLLINSQEDDSSSEDDDNSIFQKGMVVFVHGWMDKHDPRPPYTGLSTISSISKDKFDRHCFELSLPKGKHLTNVPAAVLTIPEEADFVGAPQRLRASHLKSQRDRNRPQVRCKLLKDLSSMEWKLSSMAQYLPDLPKSIQTMLLWEVAEEVLFHASKDNDLMHPPKEVVAKFAKLIEKNDLAKKSTNSFASFYDELCAIARQSTCARDS